MILQRFSKDSTGFAYFHYQRGIHGPDSRPCSNRTDYGAVNNTNFHFYCYFLIMFARINEPNKLNVKLINWCRGLFFVGFCILENFCVDNLICFKWGRFSNSSKWPQSMTEIVRINFTNRELKLSGLINLALYPLPIPHIRKIFVYKSSDLF